MTAPRRIRPHLVRTSFRLALAASLSIAMVAASAKGYGDPACQTSSELGAKFESLVTDLGTYYGSPKQDHIFRARDGRNATLRGTGKTRYLRAQIEIESHGATDWYVAAHDSMGRLLETLTVDHFTQDPEGRRTAWTSRYYLKENDGPPLVTLSVYPQDPGSLVSGKVLAYLDVDRTPSESQAPFYSSRSPDQPIQQSLFCGGATPCCEGPTPCPQAIGSEGRQFGANVAFVIIHGDSWFNGPSVRTCTGLAMPPYYVLTNWHCGYEGQTNWDAGVCLRTFVDLSFDDDSVSRDQQCEKFIHASRDLDLALLKIKSVAGPTPIPPVTFLAADCESDALGERRCPARNDIAAMTGKTGLFVVHHSRGKDKQISFDCKISDTEIANWQTDAETDFAHVCDTFPGGSGAPLIDRSARVLGIHHLGYPLRADSNGNCEPEPSGTNKAIWADEVVRYLNERQGDVKELGFANIQFNVVAP